MVRHSSAIALMALLIAACGGGSGNLTVISSSPSSIGIGDQRILLAEVDPNTNRFVGGENEAVSVEFVSPSGTSQTVPATWVWSIEGVRGFLTVHPSFDEAGAWTAAISSPRGTTDQSPFTVSASLEIPDRGQLAPRSQTRTTDDFELTEITTDPSPDPAFYDMTVAEAVGNGTPSVIVFATPAFCQTATCGPTMDIVKSVATARPDIDFVHVEVFENIDSEGAGALIEVRAVGEWGLPSEPWVFVVDGNGLIADRFEGALSVDELIAAIDLVGAG